VTRGDTADTTGRTGSLGRLGKLGQLRKQGPKVAYKGIVQSFPWWVKWIGVPVLVLAVFGSLVLSVIGFVIGLVFKLLVLVAVVAGLIFVVRRFTSSSSSRDDW
jgi:hypothetical protein